MNITALPQQAQIWLELIQFKLLSHHFQNMMFDIAKIMSNDDLDANDKAHELSEVYELYDEIDQVTILEYVTKYSKFSNKHWTK